MKMNKLVVCVIAVSLVAAARGAKKPGLAAGTKFIKDQRTDAHTFPPATGKQQARGVPKGHLRPLGFQRAPDGRLKTLSENTSAVHFAEVCAVGRLPCLLHNVYNIDEANETLGDRRENQLYGKVNVPVETTVSGETSVQLMNFTRFLKNYHYEDWLLDAPMPREMSEQFQLPRFAQCLSRASVLDKAAAIRSLDLWQSSGPSAGRVRAAADHRLACTLAGRVDWMLIRPDQAAPLRVDEVPHARSGTRVVTLDTELVNMYKTPDVANVMWMWTISKPGDCLFIPAGFMDKRRAFGRCIIATFHITPAPTNDIEFTDLCDDINEPVNMTDVDALWTFDDGRARPTLAPGATEWTKERVRQHVLAQLRDERALYIERFAHWFNAASTVLEKGGGDTKLKTALELFQLFDPQLSGSAARYDVVDANDNVWQKIVDALNGRVTIRHIVKEEL